MTDFNFLLDKEVVISGIQINYYFVCPTELWFFSHHLSMEHSSDLVSIGKLIHEISYGRERKNELIDNKIAIDFIRRGDVLEIHEVKKSPKMEKAHEMQALYYLYYLKKKGVVNTKAIIDYPKIRERKELVLTEEKEKEIEDAINKVREIIIMPSPPQPKRVRYCKKCSYYELCWGD